MHCEISHRLERGTSANEDVGPRKEVDCEIPHRLERGTKHSFIRVWKPLPSRCVLKTSKENPKEAVGFDCYNIHGLWDS